ncbi:MAG: ABC transporter ATP-binding protein [Clostridiaceae bacterium]
MKFIELLRKRILLLKNAGLLLKRNRIYFIMMFVFKVMLLASAAAVPIFYKILVDDVMVGKDTSKLAVICIGLTGLYLIDTLAAFAQRYYGNNFLKKTIFEIRCRVWKNILHMPNEDMEKFSPGDLKNRVDSDVDTYEHLIHIQLIDYLYYCLTALVVGTVTLILNWKLALFGFAMVPVSFWLTGRLGGGLRKTSEAYRKTWGKYEAWLQGSLQSWKEIKSLGNLKSEARAFTRFWHDLSRKFFKRQLYWYGNRSFRSIKDFFITRMNIYFIGGLLIFAGEFTIGGLLVFMKYYEQLFSALGVITDSDMSLNDELPSLDRVADILSKDNGMGSDKAKRNETDNVINVNGICLEDVCFKYPGQERNVLEGINLLIRKGEKLAIAGKSGCGKSTLIKLILGLYESGAGRVVIDGEDICNMSRDMLHMKIGAVMQDSMMFNLTIRENLLMAKPSASEDEIMEACRKACLDEFIGSLPKGLDTLIGEKGIKLSGGQRQRMAIARVMLSKPPVIIFDEATSALDHQTEKAIHEAIEDLSEDRTMIIIAHRLSSIIMADRVVVMDGGRIVGEGLHSSLKGNNEIYDALFLKQYNLLA